MRPTLKDAAAVNATRFEIGRRLKTLDLPITFWSGGRTKFNRTRQGFEKDHWIDAACVGKTGEAVFIMTGLKPLCITATGRGSRQMCRTDKYGFPRTAAKKVKRVHDYQTGDLVQLNQPRGKYAGKHTGKVSVRARGAFDITTRINGKPVKITSNHNNFQPIQRSDGYVYAA